MEVICDAVCLHLGVSNRALFDGVIEELDCILFLHICALKPINKLLFLLLQQIRILSCFLGFVVSLVDPVDVEFRISGDHATVHFLHV